MDLQLGPLSAESRVRGPDSDPDLGQTQMQATSEAFPPFNDLEPLDYLLPCRL